MGEEVAVQNSLSVLGHGSERLQFKTPFQFSDNTCEEIDKLRP